MRTPQERFTDVSIATRLLWDALDGRCQRQVLYTGDADLVPALELIERERPDMDIVVYVPTYALGVDEFKALRAPGRKVRGISREAVESAQFSETVLLDSGESLYKPPSW